MTKPSAGRTRAQRGRLGFASTNGGGGGGAVVPQWLVAKEFDLAGTTGALADGTILTIEGIDWLWMQPNASIVASQGATGITMTWSGAGDAFPATLSADITDLVTLPELAGLDDVNEGFFVGVLMSITIPYGGDGPYLMGGRWRQSGTSVFETLVGGINRFVSLAKLYSYVRNTTGAFVDDGDSNTIFAGDMLSGAMVNRATVIGAKQDTATVPASLSGLAWTEAGKIIGSAYNASTMTRIGMQCRMNNTVGFLAKKIVIYRHQWAA